MEFSHTCGTWNKLPKISYVPCVFDEGNHSNIYHDVVFFLTVQQNMVYWMMNAPERN